MKLASVHATLQRRIAVLMLQVSCVRSRSDSAVP